MGSSPAGPGSFRRLGVISFGSLAWSACIGTIAGCCIGSGGGEEGGEEELRCDGMGCRTGVAPRRGSDADDVEVGRVMDGMDGREGDAEGKEDAEKECGIDFGGAEGGASTGGRDAVVFGESKRGTSSSSSAESSAASSIFNKSASSSSASTSSVGTVGILDGYQIQSAMVSRDRSWPWGQRTAAVCAGGATTLGAVRNFESSEPNRYESESIKLAFAS